MERRVARKRYDPSIWTAKIVSSMRALSNQGKTAHEAFAALGMAEKHVSLSQFRTIGYKQKPPIHWKRTRYSYKNRGYLCIADFSVLTRIGEEARRKGLKRSVLATKLLRVVLESRVLIDNLLDN